MKKSKDSREIFAVFRKGSFMEGATFTEKLRYWLKNVYLYHLAVPTVITILLVVFATTLISDIINQEDNDIDYILGGDIFMAHEEVDALSDYLEMFIAEDFAEGKEPIAEGQLLCTTNISGIENANAVDEYGAASMQKITVSMADDDVLLFFFDKKYAEWYAKKGGFEPLSEFGIESENEYYIRVDTLPSMEQFEFEASDGLYAAIKVKRDFRTKKERIAQKYEFAGKALHGLVYGE